MSAPERIHVLEWQLLHALTLVENYPHQVSHFITPLHSFELFTLCYFEISHVTQGVQGRQLLQ
ncbi:hypothetical protein GOP47_0014931 [Adiantum capillus-veneris]|uniref:Uncharacterized protein n=1 Tax=Adiantum capillus-veneris TaxID=13818 RepID=A0A9D4UME7_ADICA|nr:hypothetical protein GOP47_0014931 [Adiantum capillus-veneris]